MEEKMGILNEKIKYEDLKYKQREIYNFQRVSAVFAEYGYSVTALRDDVEFADFVAVHFLRKESKKLWVQLKGRLTFWKEYFNKDLYICFFDRKREPKTWYLYPHDELYKELESELCEKEGWKKNQEYGMDSFPDWAKDYLEKYKIDQ